MFIALYEDSKPVQMMSINLFEHGDLPPFWITYYIYIYSRLFILSRVNVHGKLKIFSVYSIKQCISVIICIGKFSPILRFMIIHRNNVPEYYIKQLL